MRVLFVCCPEVGTVHPLLPLARSMADAGHAVRFATGASMRERIERTGFDVDAVGPDDMEEVFRVLAERLGGPPGAGLTPEEILPWFVPRLFAATLAPLVLPDLLSAVESWRPDLIIHDTLAFAAPIAAAVAGVPSVQHSLGLLLAHDMYRLVEEPLAPLWQQHGLEPEPLGGSFRGLCLSIAPPTLEMPVDASVRRRIRPLRPVGFSTTAGEELPAWVSALPDRPTIYVTLGTFLNSDRAVFRAVLDGLADEPLNVIVTVGRNNAVDWLDPLPANARVAQYIPQALLLPHCAALVSHGGSGTILPALGAGLPQVLLPQGADNFVNAERCHAAGVGPILRPGDVNASAVRRAVRAVLDEPSYGAVARRLAGEIAQMPGPDDVVAELVSLRRA